MIDHFVNLLDIHPALVLFIGAIFPGEEIVLFFAFLAGQGTLPVWQVFLFSFLGLVTSDILWFLIGRSRYFTRLRQYTWFSEDKRVVKVLTDRIGLRTYPALLIVTKFVYGTRVITLILLSIKKIRVLPIFLWDALALLIWIGLMVPLAWLAGRGLSQYLHRALGVQKLFLLALIFIVLFYCLNKFIVSRILASSKQNPVPQ